jgi:uncharacterized protein (TIGR00255 family)
MGDKLLIRSMTGFGRGEASDKRRKVTVEVKCVNHRYSDLNFRLPRDLGRLEEPLRRLVKAAVRRGRVDLYLSMEEYPDTSRTVSVNTTLAKGYLDALRSLSAELGLQDEIRLEHVLRATDVFQAPAPNEEEQGEQDDPVAPLAAAATASALESMLAMREREGEALRTDIHSRLSRLEGLRSQIEARSSNLVPLWRDRLHTRIQDLLSAAPAGVDQGRLEQEVAIYADRSDISEELVRWRSHMGQMIAALDAAGDESVGRRLDFLCQETLREVNTVGSKALDSEIAGGIVAAKEELERVREQLQNIE